MRRAIRYGKTVLGFDAPFLHEIAPVVIEQMGDFYTELRERQELILRTVRDEEERFRRTLDNGLSRLTVLLESEEVQRTKILPGGEGGAFTLFATYGFPLQLTIDVASESKIEVDVDAFNEAMKRHQANNPNNAKEVFTSGGSLTSLLEKLPKTEFVGYTEISVEAEVLAIIKDGETAEKAKAGESVRVVLDKTPLYAQSGGQVGDTGYLSAQNADGTDLILNANVTDTQKSGRIYLHSVTVETGVLRVGQTVRADVRWPDRLHTARNHTATHLLQAALRETVLGSHVYQKGSEVSPQGLRFDFTHSEPMTPRQVQNVENLVNELILDERPVTVHNDLPIAEAKERGAMALFGEKYGDRVRMIEVESASKELCGGTHVENTANIGLFKIVRETGVAAGVRRIEAVTGTGAIAYVNGQIEKLMNAAALLKTNPNDIVSAVERLQAQNKELAQQIKHAESGRERERFAGTGGAGRERRPHRHAEIRRHGRGDTRQSRRPNRAAPWFRDYRAWLCQRGQSPAGGESHQRPDGKRLPRRKYHPRSRQNHGRRRWRAPRFRDSGRARPGEIAGGA